MPILWQEMSHLLPLNYLPKHLRGIKSEWGNRRGLIHFFNRLCCISPEVINISLHLKPHSAWTDNFQVEMISLRTKTSPRLPRSTKLFLENPNSNGIHKRQFLAMRYRVDSSPSHIKTSPQALEKKAIKSVSIARRKQDWILLISFFTFLLYITW